MAKVTDKANRWISKTQVVSPSTKKRKPPVPVFGTSSQFKGIGRGVVGDPRK